MEEFSGGRAPDLLAQSRAYYWYHCIELQDGVITDGDYQMLDYLGNYKFPDSMAGMHVLDVGRASGFFAFEFERRGAAVTATEINSFLDWISSAAPPSARSVVPPSRTSMHTRDTTSQGPFTSPTPRGSRRSSR